MGSLPNPESEVSCQTPSTTSQANDSGDGKLSVALLNIDGLRSKTLEVQHIIAHHKLHVVALCETKLDPSVKDSKVYIPGFRMWRRDRDSSGGGVALYVQDHIKMKPRSDLMETEAEIIWVEMKLPEGRPVLLGCCYRPPDNLKHLVQIYETMDLVLKEKEKKDILLMGDFNTDWDVESTKNVAKYVSSKWRLAQIVQDKTKITNKSSTCIDLIYTTIKDPKVTSKATGCSDHNLVTAKLSRNVPQKIISLRSSEAGERTFRKTIQDNQWTNVCTESDPQKALKKFTDTILSGVKTVLQTQDIYGLLKLGDTMETLISERDQSKQSTQEEIKKRHAEKAAEQEELKKRLAENAAEHKKLKKKQEELKKKQEELKKKLKKKQEELKKKQEELKKKQEELKKKQEELKKKQDELKKKQEELKKKQEELKKKQEELKKKQEELKKKQEELKKKQEELKKKQEELKERLEKLDQSDDDSAKGSGVKCFQCKSNNKCKTCTKIEKHQNSKGNKKPDSWRDLETTRDSSQILKICEEFFGESLPYHVINITQEGDEASDLYYLREEKVFDCLPVQTKTDKSGKLVFCQIPNQTENDWLESLIRTDMKDADIPEIDAELLNSSAGSISGPIRHILNLCLKKRKFPSELKQFEFIPFSTKKRTKFRKNSLRLHSVHVMMGYILDIILYKQAERHFIHKKLIPSKSVDQIENLKTDWLEAIKSGETVSCLFLDFSSSFDSISHDFLITKLEESSFSGSALDLIRSFLSYHEGSCGLDRGSFLARLLFTVFIYELKTDLEPSSAVICQNHMIVYTKHKNSETSKKQLKTTLQSVKEWAGRHTINFQKRYFRITGNTTVTSDFKLLESLLVCNQFNVNWVQVLRKVIEYHDPTLCENFDKIVEKHKTYFNKKQLEKVSADKIDCALKSLVLL